VKALYTVPMGPHKTLEAAVAAFQNTFLRSARVGSGIIPMAGSQRSKRSVTTCSTATHFEPASRWLLGRINEYRVLNWQNKRPTGVFHSTIVNARGGRCIRPSRLSPA
jgi:hypothetical protein